jgi:hypothetical protein
MIRGTLLTLLLTSAVFSAATELEVDASGDVSTVGSTDGGDSAPGDARAAPLPDADGGEMVLFVAVPLVGHLTPLLLQADALAAKRDPPRRVVVATSAFVGSPHPELLRLMDELPSFRRGWASLVEMEFLNVTASDLTYRATYALNTTVRPAHAFALLACVCVVSDMPASAARARVPGYG